MDLLQYSKDPILVAKIQHFFGIRIHRRKKLSNHPLEKLSNERIYHDQSEDQSKTNEIQIIRKHSNGVRTAKVSTKTEENADTVENGKFVNSELNDPNFTITNKFWYYLFLFGTELGDEIFYCSFIPFWFWNIDGAVGRRVVLVWAIVMTIGQALKDIICWPRPACPPAIRLQQKWSQEYGMPSTHAMIGVSIPFSVVLFTMNRYIYSLPVGLTIAVIWCTLICTSRLYLGMHTVLDIAVGLILAILLMIPLVPLVDFMDYYFLTNTWALLLLIFMSIAIIVYYPCSDRWTPTRGDSTMVVAVTAGVHAGAWINYYIGVLSAPTLPPPYTIIWPSYSMLGHLVLRTMLGFCSIIATKALCKTLSYATMCAILKVNSEELMNSENHLDNKNKIFVDLVYKYVACFMIGFNTVYLLPNVFTMIGVERPTFYTEM